MKKFKYTFLLASAFLLASCGNTEQSQPVEESQQAKTDTEAATETASASEQNGAFTESQDEASEETNEEKPEKTEQKEFLYQVNPNNFAYIQTIEGKEANKQVALLTYDDAPDKYAMEIAQALKEQEASAIFFVNGMYLENEEGKETVKELYEMGFEIGNHTQTHASLREISEEKQYEEIVQTSDLVEEITGERPRFFRAPFGQNTEYSTQLAHEQGMELMNWTYGYDWESEYQDSAALTDIMLNTELLVSGSNLLMHDREWTKEATPGIVTGLRDKGYEILDPDLIKSVNDESEDTE